MSRSFARAARLSATVRSWPMLVFTAMTAGRAPAVIDALSAAPGSPVDVAVTTTLTLSPYRAPRGHVTTSVISREPPPIRRNSFSKIFVNVTSHGLSSIPWTLTVHSGSSDSWVPYRRSTRRRIVSSSRPTFVTVTSKSWVVPAVRDVASAPLSATFTPNDPGAGGAAGGGGVSSLGNPSSRLIVRTSPEQVLQERPAVREREVDQEADRADDQEAEGREGDDAAVLVLRGPPRHLEHAAVPPLAEALRPLLDPLLDLPRPLHDPRRHLPHHVHADFLRLPRLARAEDLLAPHARQDHHAAHLVLQGGVDRRAPDDPRVRGDLRLHELRGLLRLAHGHVRAPRDVDQRAGRLGDVHVDQRGVNRLLDGLLRAVVVLALAEADHRDAAALHDRLDVVEVQVHEARLRDDLRDPLDPPHQD